MISGKVVSTLEFSHRAYLDRFVTDVPIYWTTSTRIAPRHLFAFEIKRAALTSCLIPIDLDREELYLDQTYRDVEHFFTLKPKLEGDRFALDETEGAFWPGRFVLIGGSSDVGWYHWILNWTPRLALVAALYPELMEDENVKFVFHVTNNTEGFRAVIRAFGIADERTVFIDPEVTTFFESLLVPTFPDNRYYFPWILAAHRSVLLRVLSGVQLSSLPKRFWIARENLPGEKRKAHNFAEIEPVLHRHGIVPVILEQFTFEQQVALFYGAELIVGIHGAGLANILFCGRNSKVVILDNERNIASGMSRMFSDLAEACGLRNEVLSAQEHLVDGSDYSKFALLHNRNFIVEPQALERSIERILAA